MQPAAAEYVELANTKTDNVNVINKFMCNNVWNAYGV